MAKDRLFIGFDGIKIRLSNIMPKDFNTSYLIDSNSVVSGAKKYFLTNGKKNLSVFYTPTTKELTVEGNPLYYYQGHNFTGNLKTYQESITKIGQDLGINLFKGIVEYFEFGLIVQTSHSAKSIIAAHESIEGFKKSEITKEGYLAYFTAKHMHIKLYDASRNLQAKQNRSERSLIAKSGWNKEANYLKYEVKYEDPIALGLKGYLTLEDLMKRETTRMLGQHIISLYKRFKTRKNTEFKLQEQPSSTHLLLYSALQFFEQIGGNMNDFEDNLINQINLISDQTLSKANKAQRRRQIKASIDNCFVFTDSEFNLVKLLKHRLKSL